MKRMGPVLFLYAGTVLAQTTAPNTPDAPALEFTGSPLAIPYTCDREDLEWAGLSCGEDPCTVYVEFSHASGQNKTILITGNFHASSATLYSLLLRSDDGGRTWREPVARVRGAELDFVQMRDSKTGWVSGQTMQPLALDPFFLLTADGGKTWDRVPLFEEEGTPGSIVQFGFDSAEHGLALVDRGGGERRYEVYETNSGGRIWAMREKSDKLPKLKTGGDSDWRMRPEPKLFRLEHLEDGRWSPFASFALLAAKCNELEPKQ